MRGFMSELKLSDAAIAQIAKLLQIAILTGTDIVDNIRMVRLTQNDDGTLTPSDEYTKMFEAQLEALMNNIQTQNLEEN